jgi:O-antigen ligase
MWLIYLIDVFAVATLFAIGMRRGVEKALPFAAFVLVFVPRDAAIPMPGLFDLTTQRLVLMVLTLMYVVLPAKKSGSSRFTLPLAWLIVLHLIWCVVSTANSIVPLMSLKKMISEAFEYYLLFYLFFKSIRSNRTIDRILFGVVAAVIVSSVFGVIEAYNDWTVMNWFPTVAHHFDGWSAAGPMSGRDQRVVSTFANPILFGAGLALAIVLALYLLRTANDTKSKIFLWGGLLLMFLGIYKTSSRGPWLGLMMSLALVLVFERGRVRKYLIVLGILTLAVLIVRPGVWETIGNIYYATFDPTSPLGSSYEYRYVLRELAVKAVSKDMGRALWGYGMESFYYLGLQGNLYGKPYRFLSCDSSWVELLVETGYVGLIIAAALLFSPAWKAWKNFRGSWHRDRYMSLYLLITMGSYYFMMLGAAMYAWGQTGYMLWIIITASQAHGRLRTVQVRAARLKKVVAQVDESKPSISATVPLMDYGS